MGNKNTVKKGTCYSALGNSFPDVTLISEKFSSVLIMSCTEASRRSSEERRETTDTSATPRSQHRRSRTAWSIEGEVQKSPLETFVKPLQEESELATPRSYSLFGFNDVAMNFSRSRLEVHRAEIARHLEERRQRRLEKYSIELTDILNKVSIRLRKYAEIGNTIPCFTKFGMLFKDPLYKRSMCNVNVWSGFAGTTPKVYYQTQINTLTPPMVDEIVYLLQSIFQRVQLPFECAVIALIYIERLIAAGVIFNTLNWRPITYTACVLASKIWEDVSVWNIDFVDRVALYPLAMTQRFESLFLGICKYKLFVDTEQYAMYFFALMEMRQPAYHRIIDAHENEALKESLLSYIETMHYSKLK